MYTKNDLKLGKVNPQATYFDGYCLDKEIPGYETISVAGRELFSSELKTLIVGNQDGDRLQQNRFPARDIKVTYQIQRRSASELRESFHQLNARLLGINKKIWFEDEPNLYYVGTLSAAEEPTAGMLKFQSTFTLHCNDPFAYAMREDSFAVASAGTYDFKLDFANKIFGDFSSNPNKIYGAEWHEIENRKPDSLWWEWEQENYNKLAKQDDISGSYTRTDVGNSTRLVMRFDVIAAIEQQMPGLWQRLGLIELSERLAWLSDHIKKFYIEVWSYGHGASGYGTKVQTWSGTEWIGTQSNTASKPDKNTYSFAGQEATAAMTDGYFYVLTGTNDADATTPTVSYLDYAALSISVDAPATKNAVTVTNDGPLPVPVRFELTNHDDNGFFGLTSSRENILIGKPNDIDGGVVAKSERLFTTNQDNANGLKQWVLNKGVINEWNENPVQSGSFEDPAVIKESRWRLRNAQPDETAAWGVHAANGRGWHGPSATAIFNPDSNGAVGAKNFKARFYLQFLFGNMYAGGLQQVNLGGPDGELLVSVQFWKGMGTHGSVKIRVGNNWAYIDEYNERWDNFFGAVVIIRSGNTYSIQLESSEGSNRVNQTISYTDPDSAKILCQQATYWKAVFGVYSAAGTMNNDLYDFWIEKNNVEDYVDIPNVFSDGDQVVIDGQDGKVTTKVNGTLGIALQNVGSQPILAYPGKNVINVLHSDFASAPDITAYIRKKYL
nr:MAG TPA: distal tail protein [Caudoviricetes sp.]